MNDVYGLHGLQDIFYNNNSINLLSIGYVCKFNTINIKRKKNIDSNYINLTNNFATN